MRSALKSLAEETLAIQDSGAYDYEGRRIDIRDAQRAAVAGTKLLGPVELESLLASERPRASFDGAKEDVVRSSGLFRCLETQPGYYEANRSDPSLLYTDHIIYSPSVPFFREGGPELLPEPFLASVITAPAPNAGEHLRAVPGGRAELRVALRRRIAYVLATAEAFRHSTLVLGAWGCGVFRNDADESPTNS